KVMMELLRARALYQLGETKKAQDIFARLAQGIKEGDEAFWQDRLVDVEYRLGLRDQAREHCVQVLAVSKSPARAAILLGKVFPGQGDEAATLWAYLSRLGGKANDPAGTMK